MENSKHTPGPWINGASGIQDKTGNKIRVTATALILAGFEGQEERANTKLIATAPELLEALKELLLIDPVNVQAKHKAEVKAINAINKATE